MIRLELAGEEQAALIAGMIQESFKKQAAILEINDATHPNYAGFESPERVRARMRSGDRAVLLYSDDTAVGTISYQVSPESNTRGYIKRFAVLPQHRGRGLGPLLMNYAEQELLEIGVIRAEISIVARFERLQRYYERLGYDVFDRKTVAAFPFEILFMAKSLSKVKGLHAKGTVLLS